MSPEISIISLANSKIEQESIYNENLAFSERDGHLLFVDFNFSYTINKKEKKTVWAIQIKNLLNNGYVVVVRSGFLEMGFKNISSDFQTALDNFVKGQ